MTKSDIQTYPEYFQQYLDLAENKPYMQVLQDSMEEISEIPLEKWKAIGDTVYAEGKWTIKELLQHLIDSERVFAYRALAYARKDQQVMPSFDQEEYAAVMDVSQRTLDDLIEEFKLVRKGSIAMFASFREADMKRIGNHYAGKLSLLVIPYVIYGHQKWHFKVIEERYIPLLKS